MCSIYYSYNIYSKTSHLQSKKTLQAFPTLDYTEKKCRQKQLFLGLVPVGKLTLWAAWTGGATVPYEPHNAESQ